MNWLPLLSTVLLHQIGAPTAPVHVGTQAQLFLDRHLVHQAPGVSFTLHPAKKHPANPLINSGPQATRRVYLCGSVLYDEDENLFKMWYLGCNGELYATSRDGLKWEDSKTCWTGFMFAAVWKDRDDPVPARRYKVIAWGPNAKGVKNTSYDPPINTGYNTYTSPDGRQVTIHSREPICPHGDVIGGYSCTNHGHGHEKRPGGRVPDHAYGIGLATWQLDRFVSADAPASGGVLTTVPLVFDGRRLELNARTHPGGKIRVTLCDIAGRPLDGWPTSEAVCGNSLRHTVIFGGRSDLGTLVGKPLTLRIELVDAELFAFAFRGAGVQGTEGDSER